MSFTPSPLHHFTPLGSPKRCKSGGLICLLPPHSYTILPPLEVQYSPKRRKSFELHFSKKSSHCSSTLTSFYPPCSPTLTSFYPLCTNYPLTLTQFYPPWQPNSYIILPPLIKLPPHSYTILPPLAVQLLHHFTPSGQITPSLLHHFTPLGSPILTSFHPL